MSAIYGFLRSCICETGDILKTIQTMKRAYSACKIDKYGEHLGDKYAIACAHQFLTKYTYTDILPIEDDKCVFTADVVIDNRETLIDLLEVPGDISDGKLLYLAYKRWGDSFGEHVLGAYTAAVYDKNSESMTVYTDSVSNRCIYYYCGKDGFYFSTLAKSIVDASFDDIKISDKWIAYYLSNCLADLCLVPDLSPYEGIFQLEAGTYVSYQGGKLTKKRYYYPKKHIKRLRVSDEEGLRMFRDTFTKCVSDCLRSAGEMGATVSGGLDSSAVVSVAADKLGGEGRRLHSYTSVPIDEYDTSIDSKRFISDESVLAKTIGDKYSNLDMSFVNCQGKSSFDVIYDMVRVLEMPNKSNVNLLWLDEIYKRAASDNCKIVLKGQHGNCSISYGRIWPVFWHLVRHLKLIQAVHEVDIVNELYGIPKRRMYINLLRFMKKTMKLHGEGNWIESLHNESKLGCFNPGKLIDHNYTVVKDRAYSAYVSLRNGMWLERSFANSAAFDTKMGLYYGIIIRDPTRDRRILELCSSLPITCFAANGYERRLVREGMRGIVPDAILDNMFKQGLQGADYVLKCQLQWERSCEMVLELINNPLLDEYVDLTKLKKIRQIVGECGVSDEAVNEDSGFVNKLLMLCSLSEFLSVNKGMLQ